MPSSTPNHGDADQALVTTGQAAEPSTDTPTDAQEPEQDTNAVLPALVPVDARDVPGWFVALPPRAQQIGALLLQGYMQKDIAARLSIPASNVSAYISKYELKRVSLFPASLSRKLYDAMWRNVQSEAMKAITPGKLKASSALACAKIASIARDHSGLDDAERPPPSDMDGLDISISIRKGA
jgi:predicted transcriptional regulator